MKKLVLLSHCILNSYCEYPPAADTYRKPLSDLLNDKSLSIIQLPCPELTYQDLERESIYPGTEKAASYERYCLELLAPYTDNLKKYHDKGIDPALIIGIDTSPSCSTDCKCMGIMMNILIKELRKIGIYDYDMIDMPVTDGDTKFIHMLQSI